MARITFDTDNPQDIQLVVDLLESLPSFTENGNGTHSEASLREGVEVLMSSIGHDTQLLLQEVLVATADGPTTLADLATSLGVDYETAKARKLNLGRSVKKMQRLFPGLPDPITSRWDTSGGVTWYTMSDDVREVLDAWFQDNWTEDPE